MNNPQFRQQDISRGYVRVIQVESGPRYQIYLLAAGGTQEGALKSAFFRFEANFLGSRNELDIADQVSLLTLKVFRAARRAFCRS